MAAILVPRNSLDIVITVDPAISEKSTACRSVVTVVAMSAYNKIFLLDVWAGRSNDPMLLITKYLDLADFWQPRLIGIEGVAYQQSLKPFTEREMARRGHWYQVEMMRPDRNEKKDQRILSTQPYFRTGQIYIQRGMFEFIEEYETFPHGRTKDVLDAFAYAVRLLTPQQPDREAGIEIQLAKLRQEDPSSARYWRSNAVKRGLLEPLPTIDDILDEQEAEVVGTGGIGIGELLS